MFGLCLFRPPLRLYWLGHTFVKSISLSFGLFGLAIRIAYTENEDDLCLLRGRYVLSCLCKLWVAMVCIILDTYLVSVVFDVCLVCSQMGPCLCCIVLDSCRACIGLNEGLVCIESLVCIDSEIFFSSVLGWTKVLSILSSMKFGFGLY